MADQQNKVKGVVDIVFLLDVTGSMQHCIDALKANISVFIDSLTAKGANNQNPIKNWRGKIVGYRDFQEDAEHFIDSPFVEDATALKAQLSAMKADGGGDEPESLLDALYKVANIPNTEKGADADPYKWRYRSDAARVVVAFTDASYKEKMVEPVGGTVNDVIHAIVNNRIILSLFAPDMPCHDKLCAADRSEYNSIAYDSSNPNGAQTALTELTSDPKNFEKTMRQLAMSVTKSAEVPALKPSRAASTSSASFLAAALCNIRQPLTGDFMSTRRVADVVFCLDASNSMRPCIDGVRKHLANFVSGLQSNGQTTWDLRLDFLAHSASDDASGGVFRMISLKMATMEMNRALYQGAQSGAAGFFTNSIDEFTAGLGRVEVGGDEASLVALDTCVDFPWREAANCHRVVIFLSDEPFETGACLELQRAQIKGLIEKIQQSRIMLFMVAPESAVYDELCAVDKCEYEVIDSSGDGLSRVNFEKVLSQIGKSVSVSTQQTQQKPPSISKALFGQNTWSETSQALTGA